MIKFMGWLGMGLTIAAYLIILLGRPWIGIPLSAVGCMVYGFYAFRSRIWNLLVVQSVFLVCNTIGLIHLIYL
jgi:hypothetical protein